MRDIKFRAKRIDTGEFVYGNLIKVRDASICPSIPKDMYSNMYIQEPIEELDIKTYLSGSLISIYSRVIKVDPKTVGQFIDSKDSEGEDIYEDDIMLADHEFITGSVSWDEDSGHYSVGGKNQQMFMHLHKARANRFKVIGNIHDDPELLEEYEEEICGICSNSYDDCTCVRDGRR